MKLLYSAIKKMLFSEKSFEYSGKNSYLDPEIMRVNNGFASFESDKRSENSLKNKAIKKRRKQKTKKKVTHPVMSNLVTKRENSFPIQPLSFPVSDFAVCINSKFFQFALSSEEHRRYFVILLFAAKTVLFHSFSYDQKINIVKLLKQNFAFSPSIMSISLAQTNPGMMSEADIGVKLGPITESSYEYSSIQIESFNQLSKLILIYGHYSYYRYAIIFVLMIFKEFMLGVLIFLFQVQTGFSGTPLISYDLVVIYELLTSLFPVTLLGIFGKDLPESEILTRPLIYFQGSQNFLINH